MTGLVGLLVTAVRPYGPPALRPYGLTAQTIDTIVVRTANVFEADGDGPRFVARLANRLHAKTRASAVRRTLLLDPGQPYDSARAAESERALRALDVFRRVELDTGRVDGRFALFVSTADGWSTKPQVGYSTAGGDVTWEVGIVEENLFGTASELVASYRRTPDRRVVELEYQNPHFLLRRTPLLLGYRDLSDGWRAQWHYGAPFAETAARRSLEAGGEAADERVLVFRDGALDTARTAQRRLLRFELRGGTAPHATTRDYVRLWAGARWRREDFAPDSVTPTSYSAFATVGAGVDLSHVRFRVMRNFNAYGRREDVEVSQVLRVGLWAAPAAWGFPGDRAGVAPEVAGQLSAVWRGGFASLRLAASGVLADTGRVRGSITVASQNLPRQTWILFVEGGVAERPAPGGEFDLWAEKRGPRVFGAHAFTGTRMLWGMIESRVVLSEDFLGLAGVGLAPFLDWGGAWYGDEPERFGGNVGLALRLGPTRSGRGEAGEFAVGYRFGDGFTGRRWAVALRKALAFQARSFRP